MQKSSLAGATTLPGLWAILCLLLVNAVYAESDLAELRDQLDAHVILGDEVAINQIIARLEGHKSALGDYYRAYAHYRLGELSFDRKKLAKGHLNDCIKILKKRLKTDTDFAEALALKATCYGVSAPFYMLRAATRGMAANGAMEKAMAIDAMNPRVILAEAISLYFRPSAFGGDKEEAAKRLDDAIEQFADYAPATEEHPVWGEAEAWLYKSRVMKDLDNLAEANKAMDQALSLAPGYRAAELEVPNLRLD